MRNKFCINKKLLVLLMLVFIFLSGIYLVRQVGLSQTTNTQAAVINKNPKTKLLTNQQGCENIFKNDFSNYYLNVNVRASKDHCSSNEVNYGSSWGQFSSSILSYGQANCCVDRQDLTNKGDEYCSNKNYSLLQSGTTDQKMYINGQQYSFVKFDLRCKSSCQSSSLNDKFYQYKISMTDVKDISGSNIQGVILNCPAYDLTTKKFVKNGHCCFKGEN